MNNIQYIYEQMSPITVFTRRILMKKFLILAVLMTGNVWAGSRVILKDSKEFEVEVNNKTVLCSAKGYGLAELKINIKALDGWTILDHSNLRFGDRSGLPCMTAGACKAPWDESGFEIEDVIQANPRVEKIIVNRELTETRTLETDDQGSRCIRFLTESLDTVVGGISFKHVRDTSTTEPLPAKACKF